ncbi:MAG: DUF5723 family protein [Bacteroidales bacterium]|nr:DUF5723 family protein [Bacteroidales bacterium]MCF6342923.1 DUF5723 family protein [Bacteroidales bacterium]
MKWKKQAKANNKTLRGFLFICFALLQPWLSAQEMLGLSQGNYSGVNSILSNPAMLTNTRNYFDLNFFGLGFFARNNSVYIPASDYNIWKAIRQEDLPTYGEDNRSVLYYKNQRNKFSAVNLRLLGPSAMIQLGDHAFALSTAVRVIVSTNGIPWEMPVLGIEGLQYKPLQNTNFNDNNIDFSTAQWMEAGLSYAYNVHQRMDNRLTIGVTVKKLWGYSGAYQATKNVNYIVLNDSTINIKNLNGEVGFSVPVDYNTNDVPVGPNFRGSGVGLDVGAVFIKQKYVGKQRLGRLCGQRFEEYIYRIGISVLDIGRLKFKDNAQLHSYDDVSVYWQNFDTTNFNSINRTVAELSELFYGDPTASYRGNVMKIGLPTAISIQGDYNIRKHVYLGAFWIQPIRFNLNTMRRPAQLAFIPRYESKYLEVNLPISLLEYRYPRVGLSARFYFLTVGTERLGTWLGLADLNGLDFYFALKFSIGKGSCKQKKEGACYNSEFGYSDKEKAMFRKRKR